MVILSVPGHILLADLQSEVMETKRWLEGTFVEWKEILECSKMCVHERNYPHILDTQSSCKGVCSNMVMNTIIIHFISAETEWKLNRKTKKLYTNIVNFKTPKARVLIPERG